MTISSSCGTIRVILRPWKGTTQRLPTRAATEKRGSFGASIVAGYSNEVGKKRLSPRLRLNLSYFAREVHGDPREQERKRTFLLPWRPVAEQAAQPVHTCQGVFQWVVRSSELSLQVPKLLLKPRTEEPVLVTWGVTENVGIPQTLLLLPILVDLSLNEHSQVGCEFARRWPGPAEHRHRGYCPHPTRQCQTTQCRPRRFRSGNSRDPRLPSALLSRAASRRSWRSGGSAKM